MIQLDNGMQGNHLVTEAATAIQLENEMQGNYLVT